MYERKWSSRVYVFSSLWLRLSIFKQKNIIIIINADFIYIIQFQGDSHWKMIGPLFTFCAAASLASGFPTGETHDNLTRARDGKG
jgi:hypothetical protein